jgi:DNA-directed RNA polymerase specialized sigma24 family protein
MNDEQTRARFETLLLPLMNDAYNLSRWLMKNQEDAEDMVQESYQRAYRFFGSFHEGINYRACSCESCETHATRRWELMP